MGPNISRNFHERSFGVRNNAPSGLAAYWRYRTQTAEYSYYTEFFWLFLASGKYCFFVWGFNLRVVSANLAQSGRSLEEFKQSVHVSNNVINSRKAGFQMVIGIDAQGPLGPQHPDFFLIVLAPLFLVNGIFGGNISSGRSVLNNTFV